jgi:hypothetical protein
MCFSPQVSFSLAVMGMYVTYLSYVIPELRKRKYYVLAAFYTVMELLQTAQYFTVNQCSKPINKLLTNVAFLLVIVQPLLWNCLVYLESRTNFQRGILALAIILCIVWMIWYTIGRIYYHIDGPKPCDKCNVFYDQGETCTKRKENQHLYWSWPTSSMNGFNANYFMFFALWFIPSLMVPHLRLSVTVLMLSALFSVYLVWRFNGTLITYASTWCYISVPVIVIGFVYYLLYTKAYQK